MLLLGAPLTAADAHARFGFINRVVPAARVLPTALALAAQIAANSPDAVQCTKRGLLLAAGGGGDEGAVLALARSGETARVFGGSNIGEGLKAFVEVRLSRAGCGAAPLCALGCGAGLALLGGVC